MYRFVFIICLVSAIQPRVFAQKSLSTKSKKAAALYAEADNFRVRGQYRHAEELLQQAIAKDKKFYEAYFRLATIKKFQGHLTEAEGLFHTVIELHEGNNAPAYFELGELYLQQNEYAKAIEYIDKYLAYNPKNERLVQQARSFLTNARFGLENQQREATFKPRALNEKVNSFSMQYFPVVTVDGSAIIYTRRLGTTSQYDEDLVISRKDDNGEWGAPQSISDNINSKFNEGTCTLSADGRTLIFTSCSGRNGFGSCDLYISVKNGDEWSRPKNMGEKVNSSFWDSQPSLSADGRTLYFVSNRGGGAGTRDIWVTRQDDRGEWQKPENIGRKINTPADEISPFIHPNNKVLYFATNGRPGFGGFDIFYSYYNEGWSAPINLGAPINNGQDQVSLFINAPGNKGYYSNEDRDSKRKGILYEFDLPESQRVKYKASFVSGVVTNADTGSPLAATVELYDLRKDERVSLVYSDSVTGEYLIVLTEGSEYGLYVNKRGYLFKSYSFSYTANENLDPVRQDIQLDPIKIDALTRLNNIFFATDKYDLEEKSKTELQKLIRFLKANPNIKVEISGHTDNVGSQQYNKALSYKRASGVYDFLVKNGVSSDRLSARGEGSSAPVADNADEEGRRRNRRIEFKIVKT